MKYLIPGRNRDEFVKPHSCGEMRYQSLWGSAARGWLEMGRQGCAGAIGDTRENGVPELQLGQEPDWGPGGALETCLRYRTSEKVDETE